MIMLLLLQGDIFKDYAVVWFFLGIAILVGAALIVIFSKGREDVQITETRRADANEKYAKLKEKELEDCKSDCDDIEKEKKALELEYKALASINIKELVIHWANKEADEARYLDMKDKLGIANRRLRERGLPEEK